MADDAMPVFDTLMAMTVSSLENVDMDDREVMLVRLAALVAVDAPPSSYLLNLGAAVDSGVTLEDAQNVLVAVAPIVGTPRVASAAANIADALGFALDLEDEDEDEEDDD